MQFKLTKPCKHCPFRNDIAAFLTTGRAIEIAASLEKDATFPCHKTTMHDDDGEYVQQEGVEQHCAGALIILEKMNNQTQLMRIAERLLMYDRNRLDMNAPVFDTFDEFINAQER